MPGSVASALGPGSSTRPQAAGEASHPDGDGEGSRDGWVGGGLLPSGSVVGSSALFLTTVALNSQLRSRHRSLQPSTSAP